MPEKTALTVRQLIVLLLDEKMDAEVSLGGSTGSQDLARLERDDDAGQVLLLPSE